MKAKNVVKNVFLLVVLAIASTSYSQTENAKTQIAWDTWGVPHITADNIEELFYAQGWAQITRWNLLFQASGR